jgi:hypothetical protein
MGATYTLYADQDVPVGYVDVTNVGTTLYVDFVLDPGWYITAGHVHVADVLTDIPKTKNGNPIPGQFDYSAVFDPPVHNPDPFVVDITGLTPPLIVATHAAVEKITTGQTMYLSSDAETMVIEVNGVATTQPAVAANEPFSYPTCRYYTPSDATKSVWDNGISLTYFNIFNAAPTADWIWNAPNPDRVIEGDVVKFQEKFTIPGYPTTGSLLYITVDNAYAALLNGVFIGSAQLGPGFPTTLREEVVYMLPHTGDWGVASQGWQSAETWLLIGLVNGENTLDITAANEYMANAACACGSSGADFYLPWFDPVGGTRTADNYPIGIGGSTEGPQNCYNPGALIYKARINYDRIDQRETAWGAGTPFGGNNWATYFTYTPTV